jgi:hypothetical protein
MFQLRKLCPPLGSAVHPLYEASYSEGLIPVVEGFCNVRLPESRDYLLKMGYEEINLPDPAIERKGNAMKSKPKSPRGC